MSGKSTFGTVRTLASGKFQARYLVQGKQVSAGTHPTKKAAWAALAAVQTDMERGEFNDPTPGKVKFRDHAEAVLVHRQGDLRDTTLVQYRQGLKSLVLPTFGNTALADITVEAVDRWWSSLAHKAPARKNAYHTFSMLMRYAVRWGHIEKNPCDVQDAGKDVSAPRPEFTMADFKAVLAHAPLDLGPVLWVTFGAHLRIAETAGLNRGDYNPEDGTLYVVRQYPSKADKQLTPTKTGHKKRVALLAPARAALEAHLASTEGEDWQPMFKGARGQRLTTHAIRAKWSVAREEAGLPDFHVHDLRHVSLTLVARAGATLRDLMSRGGHTTTSQAIRYQHTSQEQDARVAALTNALLEN